MESIIHPASEIELIQQQKEQTELELQNQHQKMMKQIYEPVLRLHTIVGTECEGEECEGEYFDEKMEQTIN